MYNITQIKQLRNTLKAIAGGQSKVQIKIALLKSFKESLKLTLKAQRKKILLQKALIFCEKTKKTKEEVKNNIIKSTEQPFMKHAYKDSFCHFGQLRQIKLLILSVARQYEWRTQLNERQYKLQQQFQKIEAVKLRPYELQQLQQVSQHHQLRRINRNLSQLLNEFTQVAQFVRLQFENIQDILKTLRVKYILGKQKRYSKKARVLQYVRKKQKEQKKLQIENDENKNQYLVNL